MAELVRMNEASLISVIEGLLDGADIPYQVTERNMSILEGSTSAIQYGSWSRMRTRQRPE